MDSIKNAINQVSGADKTNDSATNTTSNSTTGSTQVADGASLNGTSGTSTASEATPVQRIGSVHPVAFKEEVEENVDANVNTDQHGSHWDYDSAGT